METTHILTDAQAIMQHMYGGKATFTLHSLDSGNRFTFQVNAKANPDKSVVYFVGLLAGPDNENDYTYLGWIRNNQFGLTKKSRENGLTEQTPSVKAFAWAFSLFVRGNMSQKLEYIPASRCARCGRTLTVPTSVHNGFGPECITKVGVIALPTDAMFEQAAGRQNRQQKMNGMEAAKALYAPAKPAVVNPNEPTDADVLRMVAALRGRNPEAFTMDGEISAEEAQKFWFRRYKKQPMSASELSTLEAQ